MKSEREFYLSELEDIKKEIQGNLENLNFILKKLENTYKK